jgi:hypothetical protein
MFGNDVNDTVKHIFFDFDDTIYLIVENYVITSCGSGNSVIRINFDDGFVCIRPQESIALPKETKRVSFTKRGVCGTVYHIASLIRKD